MSHFAGAPVDFSRSRSRHHGFNGGLNGGLNGGFNGGYDGGFNGGYDGGYDGGFGGQTEVLTTPGTRILGDGGHHHRHYDDHPYHDAVTTAGTRIANYPDAVTTTGTRIINVDDGHRHRSHRRRRHRHEPKVITTSGAQVLTTSGNNVIPAGATVINADAPRGHRRRRRGRSNRYYDPERPSSFHGFWNRMLGALTGNSRRRRYGKREMRDASAIRKARRVAQDVHESRHTNKLRRFRRHFSRHHHHHHGNRDPIVIQQDNNGRRPWLHHHRTPTAYSGYGNLIMGYLTGNRDRRAVGSAMLAAAREQRFTERNRRHNDNYDAAREYRSRRY